MEFCFIFYFIFIAKMEGDEPATTSHKGEKISSYTISFKLEVVEFAENKSITAAALKYKLTAILFVIGRKKRTSYKNFQSQLVTRKKPFTMWWQKNIERGNGGTSTRMDC